MDQPQSSSDFLSHRPYTPISTRSIDHSGQLLSSRKAGA
jgi:hypothetical protein